MSVKARFFVDTTTRRAYNPGHLEVTLKAAGRGEQNKTWAQYTPSGTLTMQINNPPAAKWFEDHLGQDIELTFAEISPEHYTSEHVEKSVEEFDRIAS